MSAAAASRKVFVAGGTGFVGSSVCREAIAQGARVVAISRTGLPPDRREAWVQQVEWVKADALQPDAYRDHLKGCTAVVHTIGLLLETDFIYQRLFPNSPQAQRPASTFESAIHGTTTLLLKEAREAGVPTFVYLSAVDPPPYTMQRYIASKRQAENELLKASGVRSVIFRPGIIYSSERLYSLPLMMAFTVLGKLGLQPASDGPVHVGTVAKAAVNACLHTSAQGIYDVPAIERLAVDPAAAPAST